MQIWVISLLLHYCDYNIIIILHGCLLSQHSEILLHKKKKQFFNSIFQIMNSKWYLSKIDSQQQRIDIIIHHLLPVVSVRLFVVKKWWGELWILSIILTDCSLLGTLFLESTYLLLFFLQVSIYRKSREKKLRLDLYNGQNFMFVYDKMYTS